MGWQRESRLERDATRAIWRVTNRERVSRRAVIKDSPPRAGQSYAKRQCNLTHVKLAFETWLVCAAAFLVGGAPEHHQYSARTPPENGSGRAGFCRRVLCCAALWCAPPDGDARALASASSAERLITTPPPGNTRLCPRLPAASRRVGERRNISRTLEKVGFGPCARLACSGPRRARVRPCPSTKVTGIGEMAFLRIQPTTCSVTRHHYRLIADGAAGQTMPKRNHQSERRGEARRDEARPSKARRGRARRPT